MRNLPFLMARIEKELKTYHLNSGEPIYCLLKTGLNSYSYKQLDLPEEFKSYFNDEGKLIIDGDDNDSCANGLNCLHKIANYYREKIYGK